MVYGAGARLGTGDDRAGIEQHPAPGRSCRYRQLR